MNHNKLILTKRQIEILKYRSDGYLNKQIAYELGICEDTVKHHLSLVLQKLNIKSVTQAIVKLIREDVI